MILTIIAMLMIPVGVWMVRKDKYEGVVYMLGLLSAVCGGLIAFIMAICIICAHVGVDAQIEKNRIEYESLCQRYEVERCRLDVEVKKLKVLSDIRDVMLMMNGMMGLEIETNAKAEKYNKADQERLADDLADIKKRIEKRRSE